MKGFISADSLVVRKGRQLRNSRLELKQRGERNAAFWPGWSAFFYNLKLRGGTAHSGRGLPTPVVNQENARKLKGQSDGGNSSTNSLLPR